MEEYRKIAKYLESYDGRTDIDLRLATTIPSDFNFVREKIVGFVKVVQYDGKSERIFEIYKRNGATIV